MAHQQRNWVGGCCGRRIRSEELWRQDHFARRCAADCGVSCHNLLAIPQDISPGPCPCGRNGGGDRRRSLDSMERRALDWFRNLGTYLRREMQPMIMRGYRSLALAAHCGLVGSVVVDYYRRESEGAAAIMLAVIAAILLLSSFIYFVNEPRSFFFFNPANSDQRYVTKVSDKGLWRSAGAWLLVVGWAVGWLLFVPRLSDLIPPLGARLVGTYLFMIGVTISILLSSHLFAWRNRQP